MAPCNSRRGWRESSDETERAHCTVRPRWSRTRCHPAAEPCRGANLHLFSMAATSCPSIAVVPELAVSSARFTPPSGSRSMHAKRTLATGAPSSRLLGDGADTRTTSAGLPSAPAHPLSPCVPTPSLRMPSGLSMIGCHKGMISGKKHLHWVVGAGTRGMLIENAAASPRRLSSVVRADASAAAAFVIKTMAE